MIQHHCNIWYSHFKNHLVYFNQYLSIFKMPIDYMYHNSYLTSIAIYNIQKYVYFETDFRQKRIFWHRATCVFQFSSVIFNVFINNNFFEADLYVLKGNLILYDFKVQSLLTFCSINPWICIKIMYVYKTFSV